MIELCKAALYGANALGECFKLTLSEVRWKDNMVKRRKGLRRMPWRIEAKKAVASCEKRRGGANIP